MVALIVHSELLSTVQGAPQSDRDTVEPQIQILKEFVAHNAAWCGLATKPDDARKLIEQNRLAFVLGLENGLINGWINRSDFDPADRVAIHTQLHDYFKYLRGLGVVQINLIHLSDNAFGGMALYDLHFMLNTWARTGQFPDTDPVPPTPDPTMTDDDINCRVTVKSALWTKIEALATSIGWQPLSAAVASPIPPAGDRNRRGLTTAGEEAVLEAMRFGMVIDLDHMSEKSAETAHTIAMKPMPTPYPLVSAHNGARRMAPRPLAPTAPPSPPALPPPPAPQVTPPKSEYRRGEHLWPNENSKSAAQLQFIKETGGMFGHGTAAADTPLGAPWRTIARAATRRSPRASSTSVSSSRCPSASARTGTRSWWGRGRGSGRAPRTGSKARRVKATRHGLLRSAVSASRTQRCRRPAWRTARPPR